MVAGLERHGVAATLHLTRGRGDGAARVAAPADEDVVVAVGGDGTLREVLAGLPPRDVPIGVVPAGTANVLALDLALPRDPARAVDVILAGRTTALDTGRVNGHLCFLVTGVGLDGEVVRAIDRRRRGPITRWHYAAALVRLLPRYRPARLSVEVDGEAHQPGCVSVLISNSVRYAGIFRLSAERRLDDGRFEVYLFGGRGRAALLGGALRGLLGRLPGGACTLRRARRVRVSADVPVAVQVDGDPGGTTPVEFEVAERRYRVLVP